MLPDQTFVPHSHLVTHTRFQSHNSLGCSRYDQANLLLSYQTVTALEYVFALHLLTCSPCTNIYYFGPSNSQWTQKIVIADIYDSHMPGLTKLKTVILSHISLMFSKIQSYWSSNNRKLMNRVQVILKANTIWLKLQIYDLLLFKNI